MPSTATMPAITHVALTVTDLAVSEAWYTEVLGVATGPRRGHRSVPAHRVLDRRDAPRTARLPTAEQLASFDERRPGLDHVSFGVASRDELVHWADRLDELGIPHGEILDARLRLRPVVPRPGQHRPRAVRAAGILTASARPGTARAVPHWSRSAIATVGDDDCPEGTSATMRTANEIAVASAVLVLARGAAAADAGSDTGGEASDGARQWCGARCRSGGRRRSQRWRAPAPVADQPTSRTAPAV